MEAILTIRNVLLRGFVINYALILFVWILSFTPLFSFFMAMFFDFTLIQTQAYLANIIALWKIVAVVFYLIPALAIHWEYKSSKVRRGKKRK